jgi:uncharacterized membrane protein YgaE (UPF0421/DUF939 family)
MDRHRYESKILSQFRLLNAAKTSLAIAIGLLLTWALSDTVAKAQWIVISSVVVMATLPNVGGVLQKAALRVGGTILAGVVAIVLVLILGGHPIAVGAALVIICGFFVYLGGNPKIGYLGSLAAITLIIMVDVFEPHLEQVLWRGINIVVGVSIALLVTRFVFPIRARLQLRLSMAETVDQFGKLVRSLEPIRKEKTSPCDEVEDCIVQGILMQRGLLPLAATESRGFRSNRAAYEDVILAERMVLRVTQVIRYAMGHSEEGAAMIRLLEEISPLREDISLRLEELANGLRKSKQISQEIDQSESGAQLKQDLRELMSEVSDRTFISPPTFVFAMEYLRREVNHLHEAINKML